MYASQTLADEETLKVDLFSNWQFLARKQAKLLHETRRHVTSKQEVDVLRFEISSEKIQSLLSNRQIVATDLHCLDAKSKQCLQALCLKTCLLNTS